VSIRNQVRGAIVGVSTGDAMAVVRISVPDGELTAAVTLEAVNDLGLAPGQEIVALVKATEVSLATA
jgi:molybdate transport system regulatory protein